MGDLGQITAAHFIFIPSVLLIGIVIGWVLGSRAARDAYAAELRRREEREKAPRGREGVRRGFGARGSAFGARKSGD